MISVLKLVFRKRFNNYSHGNASIFFYSNLLNGANIAGYRKINDKLRYFLLLTEQVLNKTLNDNEKCRRRRL